MTSLNPSVVPRSSPQQHAGGPAAATRTPPTVLIVDDHPDTAETLEGLLSLGEPAVQVVTAADGEAA